MGYISKQGLINLKEYKYHGVDHSIFARLLQHWWTWAINLVPLWLAPNLITLIGTFFLVLSFVVQYYYCPYVEGSAPRITYLLHFFCLFIYQTMDALDGKQARRTKSSSPLGELFDHGCDAISVSLIGLTVSSTLQIGANWILFALMMTNFVAFYFAQWEEYHTGTLELGYFNVTEAQLLLMIVHLTTYFVGPEFWASTIVLPINVELFGVKVSETPIQIRYIFMAMQGVGAAVTLLGNIVKMESARRKNRLSTFVVYSHLVPVIVSVGCSAAWAYYSPQRILNTHPTSFLLGVGFLFANLVGRIVIARVCQEKFHWFQPLVLPLIFGAVNAYLKEAFVNESLLVMGNAVFCIAAYFHFALSVINVLCAHLKIRCLSIPVQKAD